MPAPRSDIDPPIPVAAIWAAGIVGTPLLGLALALAWRVRRPRAAAHARRAAAFGLVIWLLVGQRLGVFGGDPTRDPVGPPPRTGSPAAAGTTAPAPAALPGDPPKAVTFTQIMLLYKRDKSVPTVTRTREEALVLARTLIDRIQKGTSMEALVLEFTDDRGNDGKPFNSGSYSMARNKPANEDIKRTAFGLAVGALAPEPVDSGFAWHVIRRDL